MNHKNTQMTTTIDKNQVMHTRCPNTANVLLIKSCRPSAEEHRGTLRGKVIKLIPTGGQIYIFGNPTGGPGGPATRLRFILWAPGSDSDYELRAQIQTMSSRLSIPNQNIAPRFWLWATRSNYWTMSFELRSWLYPLEQFLCYTSMYSSMYDGDVLRLAGTV